MKYCKKCGTALADDAIFCTNCGYQTAASTQTGSPKDESATKVKRTLITVGLAALSFGVQIGVFYFMMSFGFGDEFFDNLAPLFGSLLLQILFIVILFLVGKSRAAILGKICTGISVAMAAVSVFIDLFVNMLLGFWLFVFACELSVGAFLLFKMKVKEKNKYSIPILVLCAVFVISSYMIPAVGIYPKYQRLDSHIADISYFCCDGVIKASRTIRQRLEYSNSNIYRQYIEPTLGAASAEESFGKYDKWALQYVYLNDYELSVPEYFSADFKMCDYFKDETMEPSFTVLSFSGTDKYRIPKGSFDYYSSTAYLGTYEDYLTEVLQMHTNLTKQEAKELVEIIADSVFAYQFVEETSATSNGMQTPLLSYEVIKYYSYADRNEHAFPGTVRLNYYPKTGRLFVGFIFGEAEDAIIFQFKGKSA